MQNEKILEPLDIDTKFIDAVDRQLVLFFKREIYQPLFVLVSDYGKLENSELDVMRAIQKGTINFHRGYFTGKFNSKLSKELKKMGATWSTRYDGSFKLLSVKLSSDIKLAVRTAESSWLRTSGLVNQKLSDLLGEDLTEKIDVTNIIDKALFSLDNDINKQVKGLTVVPEMTAQRRKDIAENYTNNMRYYINDFTEKEIVKLRKKVSDSVLSGTRYETLAKQIKQSYGVSQSKATFLAKQETNLLLAKFTESRYNEIGIDEYIWTTVVGSPDHPVRESHKRLNGLRFKFSDPPVVNIKGDRKNPSEDFGCRCKAKAVVRF